MADDPCECILSHEMAMRRLIALLRNSQSYCSDTECFQELPGASGGSSGDFNIFMITMVWAVIAFALFYLRPARLRNSGDSKPSGSNDSGNPPPPNSPVH